MVPIITRQTIVYIRAFPLVASLRQCPIHLLSTRSMVRNRACAHQSKSCAQASARTTRRLRNLPLDERGGRGGEERRSVAARPPKVKSRGGTRTEGNRLQLFNENTRLRVNHRELGGWIPAWLPFGLSLWSLG